MESSNNIKEILDEYGLHSVSLKTKIPTDTLKKLEEGDYAQFTKIQILGFAKIFEREYDLDLTQFKNDIREYYTKNVVENSNVKVADSTLSSGDGFFVQLLMYIFVIGLLYGAWYIYENYYKKSMEPTVITSENRYFDIEKNRSSLDTKKESIYSMKLYKNKKKTPSDELNQTVVTLDTNHSSATSIETNKTLVVTSIEKAKKESNVTKITTETDITKSVEINSSETLELNDSADTEPIVNRTSIDLIPSQKSWFRLSNMNTRRYRTYRNQIQAHQFDVVNGGWLMASKKGIFTFIDNNVAKEYNSNHKILYFKIDRETGVTQLSQEEYKRLGGHGVR